MVKIIDEYSIDLSVTLPIVTPEHMSQSSLDLVIVTFACDHNNSIRNIIITFELPRGVPVGKSLEKFDIDLSVTFVTLRLGQG